MGTSPAEAAAWRSLKRQRWGASFALENVRGEKVGREKGKTSQGER